MKEFIEADLFKSKLERDLRNRCARIGLPKESIDLEIDFEGRKITLRVEAETPDPAPVPLPPLKLKPSQKDCLRVLRESNRPMKRTEILIGLAEMGRPYGNATIATSLADLVVEGILKKSKKLGGYYLPSEVT